jgi:transposase
MASRSKKVLFASERDEETRAAWREMVAGVDPGHLIFLDETGTNLSLTRRYGRAYRGQRLVGTVPRNHGPNVTLIAAMDQHGLCGEMTLTGALDGRAFETYVTRILVPHLWPGDFVICDNLSAHKQATARRWIEATGAQVCFLPPYSPDYNPIELAFSKLKAALRAAGARTRDELEQAITVALGTITSQDATAWFRHCGYAKSEQLI